MLALVSPFCGLEVLYRWGLARVGVLPRLPSEPHVGRLQRALWAAEEGGPMDVQPLWPWTLVGVYARVLETRHGVTTPGAHLANSVARLWLAPRGLRILEWHWQQWSLSIWLSRHASAEQLADEASQQLFFGRGAFGADAAARTYFGVEPAQLTWAQAAFLAGLVQRPSLAVRSPEAARKRARWVLGRLFEADELSLPDYERALAEAPPGGSQPVGDFPAADDTNAVTQGKRRLP